MGVIPADAELTVRPEEIEAWEDVPDELKPVLSRQMEVYAGYMEHTDHQVGRVVDALEGLEILDDTLIIYVTGDNGGSGEGGPNGTFNWMIPLNGAQAIETPEFMAERIDFVRHPGRAEPLRGRLGARDGHPLPMGQADRLALGWHPQRHDRALAARLQRAG
jgi:arylsulfatase A-like enzyme